LKGTRGNQQYITFRPFDSNPNDDDDDPGSGRRYTDTPGYYARHDVSILYEIE